MDSFYGGKQGASFIIKATYDSISTMATSFKGGENYTDVWFDEYVIIDTPNKNNADNGKIYKRGLNYNDSLGGAIYVGQIVGPSAGTPFFNMTTLSEVQSNSKIALAENEYRLYAGESSAETGPIAAVNDSSVTPAKVYSLGSSDGNLVPGYNKTTKTYNDDIKYSWVNIRKPNQTSDSLFYVGFQIPYLVVDFNVKSISPYNNAGELAYNPTIEQNDTTGHPYYENWTIGINKGIKGDTLRNLRVITPTSSDVIYKPSVDSNGKLTYSIADLYKNNSSSDAEFNQIIVYDYYHFDDKENGEPITVYLGDYNMVQGVQLDNDGTLTFKYSNKDDDVFSKRIKYISSLTLDVATGVLNINFNTHNSSVTAPDFTAQMDWVKDLAIADDGSVTFTHTKDSSTKTKQKLIQWIKSMSLVDGVLTVNYNNGGSFSQTLDWIKDIQLSDSGILTMVHSYKKDGSFVTSNATETLKWIDDIELKDGILTLNYNTHDSSVSTPDKTWTLPWIKDINVASDGTITFTDSTGTTSTSDNKIQWITNATLASDGTLTFTTNTKDSTGTYNTITVANKIKAIKDIQIPTSILSEKQIQVQYNTDDSNTYTTIGPSINYVEDMVVNSNHHLLGLFSSPNYRKAISNGVSYSTASDGTALVWKDFGSIKDDSGLLIGLNVDTATVTASTYTDILSYLNGTYPTGLNTGKIVTYGTTTDTTSNKNFYAYNYDSKSWYYLGNLVASSDSATYVLLLDESSTSDSTLIQPLKSNGLIFEKSTLSNVITDAIPNTWESTYVAS